MGGDQSQRRRGRALETAGCLPTTAPALLREQTARIGAWMT
jgi:hypothetical protein